MFIALFWILFRDLRCAKKYFIHFSQSIIPTQQQLQEIYEENLRQREISKLSSDSAARAQFLEDERVALMLQNEEFMSELRRDQVFTFFGLVLF